MTTTPPEAPQHPRPSDDGSQGPRVSSQEMRDLARMRRSRMDRRVAGVCSGLARHFDIDPVIVRVAFVVLTIFGGVGLVLYGVCWLLIPDEGSGRGRIALDDRSRAVALIIAGVIAGLVVLGVGFGGGPPWPVVIVVGLIAWWLLSRRGQRPAPPTYVVDATPSDAPDADGDNLTAVAPVGYPTYDLKPQRRPRQSLRPLWTVVRVIALGLILLGLVDLLGVSVVASAYPALALGIVGLALLYGAFRGRVRGLVPLGLLCALVLTAVTAGEQIDPQRTETVPASAAEVRSSYDMGNGRLVLDLTRVSDVGALDGRTVTVDGGIGDLHVILPPGLNVDTTARLTIAGGTEIFGSTDGGANRSVVSEHVVSGTAPTLHLDLRLRLGQISVDRVRAAR